MSKQRKNSHSQDLGRAGRLLSMKSVRLLYLGKRERREQKSTSRTDEENMV